MDLEKVIKSIPDDDTLIELSDVYKIFGDYTRTKILCALKDDGLIVSEIAEALNMSLSAVSHQLRILRQAKLIKGVKQGKEVKYYLDDDHVGQIIECGLSHINEVKYWKH